MKKKLLIAVSSIVLILGLVSQQYGNSIYGKKYSFTNKTIVVKKGDNFYKVLEKLEITKSSFLKIYIRLHSEELKKVNEGMFSFDGTYSFKKIIETIQSDSNNFVMVTIPEGFGIKQIKERLNSKGIISPEDFDKALGEIKDFYYETPNGNFNGYLFPDTYQFFKGENGVDVVNKFLKRFIEKFPPEKYPDKKEFYNKLVLASIIEKEAGNKDEMPKVASVFQNRLDKGMKLQSCATVAYLFDFEKDYIYYKDLEIDSPYNTYKYKGLPPGPISNPGELSIKASLEPAKTDYFYFVLGNNGKHHFSKTYNEHIAVQKNEKRGVQDDGKIRVKR